MSRPKEFDKDQALNAAIGVFREHGFEGTSASMLVDAMKIGRQSLYDTFGDKWQLYCASVRRYSANEAQEHFAALRSEKNAVEGLRALFARVVANSRRACLGMGSIAEFGRSRDDLSAINDAAGRALSAEVATFVRHAQAQGDVSMDLEPDSAASFLIASIASIRLAARGGATQKQLLDQADLTLRALR